MHVERETQVTNPYLRQSVAVLYKIFDTGYYPKSPLKNSAVPQATPAQPEQQQAKVDPTDHTVAKGSRASAVFVTLARNSDVWDIAGSIKLVEDRFNRQYNYDWVFLNDNEFDDQFKSVVSNLVSGHTYFGLVPKEHWSYPDWIDQAKAAETRESMVSVCLPTLLDTCLFYGL